MIVNAAPRLATILCLDCVNNLLEERRACMDEPLVRKLRGTSVMNNTGVREQEQHTLAMPIGDGDSILVAEVSICCLKFQWVLPNQTREVAKDVQCYVLMQPAAWLGLKRVKSLSGTIARRV